MKNCTEALHEILYNEKAKHLIDICFKIIFPCLLIIGLAGSLVILLRLILSRIFITTTSYDTFFLNSFIILLIFDTLAMLVMTPIPAVPTHKAFVKQHFTVFYHLVLSNIEKFFTIVSNYQLVYVTMFRIATIYGLQQAKYRNSKILMTAYISLVICVGIPLVFIPMLGRKAMPICVVPVDNFHNSSWHTNDILFVYQDRDLLVDSRIKQAFVITAECIIDIGPAVFIFLLLLLLTRQRHINPVSVRDRERKEEAREEVDRVDLRLEIVHTAICFKFIAMQLVTGITTCIVGYHPVGIPALYLLRTFSAVHYGTNWLLMYLVSPAITLGCHRCLTTTPLGLWLYPYERCAESRRSPSRDEDDLNQMFYQTQINFPEAEKPVSSHSN